MFLLNRFIDINVDFAVVNGIAHTQKCVNNSYSKHDQFKLFRPLSRCLFAFLFKAEGRRTTYRNSLRNFSFRSSSEQR